MTEVIRVLCIRKMLVRAYNYFEPCELTMLSSWMLIFRRLALKNISGGRTGLLSLAECADASCKYMSTEGSSADCFRGYNRRSNLRRSIARGMY